MRINNKAAANQFNFQCVANGGSRGTIEPHLLLDGHLQNNRIVKRGDVIPK